MGYNTGEVTVKNDCTQYYFKLAYDSETNTAGSIIHYTLMDGSIIRPGQTANIHVTANCPYQDFLGGSIRWKMKVYRVSNQECIGTLSASASLREGKTEVKEAVTSVDTRFMTKTTFTSADVKITKSFHDAAIEPNLELQAENRARWAAAEERGKERARKLNSPSCRIM